MWVKATRAAESAHDLIEAVQTHYIERVWTHESSGSTVVSFASGAVVSYREPPQHFTQREDADPWWM